MPPAIVSTWPVMKPARGLERGSRSRRPRGPGGRGVDQNI